MKVRLLQMENGNILLLCNNGTIIEKPDTDVLYNLMVNHKRSDALQGKDGHWAPEYPDMMLYPGETLAYVTEQDFLVIADFTPFYPLLSASKGNAGYISVAEFAQKHNKSVEIVKVFCRTGRIPGAKKVGKAWTIPADAHYPVPPEYQRVGWQEKRKTEENKS